MPATQIMKVQFRYSVPDYYKYHIYKQKTIKMEIPTDENGFTLLDKLSDNITKLLRETVNTKALLIWHRVIQPK